MGYSWGKVVVRNAWTPIFVFTLLNNGCPWFPWFPAAVVAFSSGSRSLSESGSAFVAVASILIFRFLLKQLDSDSDSDPDPDFRKMISRISARIGSFYDGALYFPCQI